MALISELPTSTSCADDDYFVKDNGVTTQKVSLRNLLRGTGNHAVTVGNYGSTWNVTTTWQTIGNGEGTVDNDYFATATNGQVTLKRAGIYGIRWSGRYNGEGKLWGRIMGSAAEWATKTMLTGSGGNMWDLSLVTFSNAGSVINFQVSADANNTITAQGSDHVEVVLIKEI